MNKSIDKNSTNDTGTEALKVGYQAVDVSKQAAQTAYKGAKIAANSTASIGRYITAPHTRLQSIKSETKEIANMSEQLKKANKEIVNISERIADKKEKLNQLSSIENKTSQQIEEIKIHKNDINYLDSRRDKLVKESQKLNNSITQKKDRLEAIRKKLKLHPIKKVSKTAFTLSKSVVKTSFRITQNVAVKANPFNKAIDTNSTTDTGYDALKFANKTLKTTKNVARTSVRTAKAAVKAPKKAVNIIYRTPVRTVKGAIRIVRVATTVAAHVVAIVLNPVFWVLAILLLLAVTLLYPLVLMLAGGAAAETETNVAYGSAAGTNMENTDLFNEAQEFYRIACENRQNEFNDLINSFYFSYDDLSHSDLVYMVTFPDLTTFEKSMATDTRKEQLKDKFSNSISKATAISLLYVKLEKEKNDENNTEGEIYDIEFTQEAFDDMLSSFVTWTHNEYNGQECPQRNCSVHRDEIPNPQYDEATHRVNMAAGAFNDWGNIIPFFETYNSIRDGRSQAQYWDNNIGWRIDNWNYVYGDFVPAYPDYSRNGENFLDYLGRLYEGYVAEQESTPPTITETTTTCDHAHNLHTLSLDVLDKDAIMDSWGFSDLYKEWVEITYQGFIRNPNILDEDKEG